VSTGGESPDVRVSPTAQWQARAGHARDIPPEAAAVEAAGAGAGTSLTPGRSLTCARRRPAASRSGDRRGNSLHTGRQRRIPAADRARMPDRRQAEIERGTVRIRAGASVVPVEHVFAQPGGGKAMALEYRQDHRQLVTAR
jgi:hypothetical protein